MKTLKNLAFLFIATLLVGFTFTSCSDDDEDDNLSINPPAWTQGKWTLEDEDLGTVIYTITSNNVSQTIVIDGEAITVDFKTMCKYNDVTKVEEKNTSDSYIINGYDSEYDEWYEIISLEKSEETNTIYIDGYLATKK